MIVGGAGAKRTPRLAARYASEFNVPFRSADDNARLFSGVRAACDVAGRDPSSLVYSSALVLCVGKDEPEIARRAAAIGRDVDDLRAHGVAGTPAEAVDTLRRYVEAGAQRFYLQVLDLSDLDHLDLVAGEVAPQLGMRATQPTGLPSSCRSHHSRPSAGSGPVAAWSTSQPRRVRVASVCTSTESACTVLPSARASATVCATTRDAFGSVTTSAATAGSRAIRSTGRSRSRASTTAPLPYASTVVGMPRDRRAASSGGTAAGRRSARRGPAAAAGR